MRKKEHQEYLKLLEEDYPLGVLVGQLDWVKNHLKKIKKSREKNPHFYFPDAEDNMKKRIVQLKATIKKLQE